jgi:diaminopimelate decarboxylase
VAPSAPQLHALAEAHGTPLFVIDAGLARRRARELRGALGGRVDVLYAAKANAHPAVLAALHPAVDGADCTSAGELDAARQAGFADSTLQLSGPAKGGDELGASVRLSLSCVQEGLAAKGPALLRVNPSARIQAFRSTTGGVSPFGVPEEDLPAALAALRDTGVELEGLHVHRGSQCSSAAAWRRHALDVLDLAHASRLALRRLNLGGGFASPRPGVPAMDLAALRPLIGAFDRFAEEHPGVAFAVEPGRLLLGEAGVLLLRTVRARTVRGQPLAVLDGGLDCFLFATEGQRPGPPHAVDNLSRTGRPQAVELFGPSCTPRDRFGAPPLVRPQAGDLLALRGAGAYAWGASPHGFLGRPQPALVVID